MSFKLLEYDVITKEDVMEDASLAEELMSFINTRWNRSWNFVQRKRQAFHGWKLLMTDPSRIYQKEQYIKVYTAVEQLKAFIATFLDEEFSVEFTGREFGDDDKAFKLNQLARYDNKAMKKTQKDYHWLSDIFTYGVGIRIQTGYDLVKNVPIYEVVSPEYWVPDLVTDTTEQTAQYHFFEMVTSRFELELVNKSNPDTYFNLEDLQEDTIDDDNGYREQKQDHRLLSSSQNIEDRYRIVNCYITIGHRKYMVTLGNQRSLIIRFEVIEAETKEEKENPYLIPFPINVTHSIPMREDPYGLSLLELIIDKQNAQNRLMNLALIQEQENVFQKFIVDTDIIPNLDLLKAPTDRGHQYIAASSNKSLAGKNITNSIQPINDKMPLDTSKLSLSETIDQLVQSTTGFTDQNRGLQAANQTLGQAQIQQQNSNLLFNLDATMIGLGEEDFWLNIWYRSIKAFFPKTKDKLFRIGSGISGRTFTFNRDDILSSIDPDVTIISKRRKMDEERQMLAQMNAQWPLIQQDPNIPQVSKSIYFRKMLELQGVSREEALITMPLSPDEMRARDYLELLNNYEVLKKRRNVFGSLFQPGMDHFTYWIYLNTAVDSDMKQTILQTLEQEMIKKGLNKMNQAQVPGQEQSPEPGQQGGLNGLQNSIASQNTSALIAENRNQTEGVVPGL